MNFAVNAVGTFAMTELMLPLLRKAAPDARVITVSSGGMYSAPLPKDLQADASSPSLLSCRNTAPAPQPPPLVDWEGCSDLIVSLTAA